MNTICSLCFYKTQRKIKLIEYSYIVRIFYYFCPLFTLRITIYRLKILRYFNAGIYGIVFSSKSWSGKRIKKLITIILTVIIKWNTIRFDFLIQTLNDFFWTFSGTFSSSVFGKVCSQKQIVTCTDICIWAHF